MHEQANTITDLKPVSSRPRPGESRDLDFILVCANAFSLNLEETFKSGEGGERKDPDSPC